jgi:hypothetical protein
VILILMELATFALWGLAGWALCGVTHRQRGIETDEVGVPDFVPPEWSSKVDR